MLGARVIVQPSTLIMIAVLAFLWASRDVDGLTSESLTRGATLALLLFASVFVHEVAHAATARFFRREVSEIVITLWGGHTSFDGRGMTPVISGVTSAAGPAMNMVVAASAYGVSGLAVPQGAHDLLAWLIYANVALAVFNSLPGIPMDGGRVFEAAVWAVTGSRSRGTIAAAWGGRAVAGGFVAFVVLRAFSEGRTPGIFELVWAMFVFSLLWPPASAALRSAQLSGRAEVVTAAKVMRAAAPVKHNVSVADALREAERADADEVVVMSADGSPAGHFATAMAREVPVDVRSRTELSAVTLPLPRGATAASDLTGHELLEEIREWWGKTDALVVLDDAEVVGVVLLKDVIERLK